MKRIFDVAVTLCMLAIFAPIIGLVAWKVRVNLGTPVLFRQTRPGLNGQPFEMIKFRTMKDAVDVNGKALPDSERMTSFGDKLRNSSLDELPELWNVLKGDMSLVGPRPLLTQYLPLYNEEQAKRHNEKPGVTGWAQINGRNAISWEDKFKLDVWYVENRTFWLDIKILFLTVKKVFIKEGISAEGDVTMPPFKGNKIDE
ncbi:sugar transferase [Vibrio breoganii]|uniref:sugar transferase n=1 Tax=Vibrio breoganii TaxID=553239 RepID=UPI000CB80E68|nr:sugar transferase [Vibrio breoganii]PMJ45898.1 sugar transferase [Vibrio breoganii]PMK63342.1 sugar transferase [Vibrio breoganii]PML39025.1 sugar transferase [Vibrio breoganii]PMO26346.1 sugar transferase [Vibrio breoganii]PMO30936.1 sugar transferase [Vibrio breoganii]